MSEFDLIKLGSFSTNRNYASHQSSQSLEFNNSNSVGEKCRLTGKTLLLSGSLIGTKFAFGERNIFLEQSSPGGHVNIHLFWARHLSLLTENLPLAT